MKITTEMEYLKGKGQISSSSSSGEHRPCWSRHALRPTLTRYSHCTPEVEDRIKVGSFYEIDTSKLAPETPEQLKSIRVVMVNEKSPLKISLRFPSIYSLRTHLKDGSGSNPDGKKLPALDEKYVMGSDHAVKVLSRRIPSQELADQRNSWGFWVGDSIPGEGSSSPSPALDGGVTSIAAPKKGLCLSELLGTGMVQWGKRRQVRFLRRHEEAILKGLSNEVKGHEEEENREKEDPVGIVEEMEESDNPDDGDSKDVVSEYTRETRSGLLKRKRHGSTMEKAKKAKPVTQKPFQAYQGRRKTTKSSIDRWSIDRYKLAEMNMLKILKAKGAVFGKPILRPALRAEARKLIGDTGLLDHLLKHMAGKVAPGGVERFRRRHNADGAMEYWLESADLMNVRKEAGVQDPYWTPPPGWQPGDNPTMDPVCARELNELKEEMDEMRREMKALVSKKQCDNQVMVAMSSPSGPCEHLEGASSILSKQEMYAELVRKKGIVEEQLVKISQSLIEIEEMMKKLNSTEKDSTNKLESPGTKAAAISNSGSEMKKDRESGGDDKAERTESEDAVSGGEKEKEKENKAAKIERLKSGFRLCKPQGTFLWPDMGMSVSPSPHQVLVPTPPSASSSSIPPPPFSPPPVKPLAERRAVPGVVTAFTGLINLNEAPKGDSTSALCITHLQPPDSSSNTYPQSLPLQVAATTTAGGN